jgi:hypothetical protein
MRRPVVLGLLSPRGQLRDDRTLLRIRVIRLMKNELPGGRKVEEHTYAEGSNMSKVVPPSFVISYPTTVREWPGCWRISGMRSDTTTGVAARHLSCTEVGWFWVWVSKYRLIQSSKGVTSKRKLVLHRPDGEE